MAATDPAATAVTGGRQVVGQWRRATGQPHGLAEDRKSARRTWPATKFESGKWLVN